MQYVNKEIHVQCVNRDLSSKPVTLLMSIDECSQNVTSI